LIHRSKFKISLVIIGRQILIEEDIITIIIKTIIVQTIIVKTKPGRKLKLKKENQKELLISLLIR